jgi:hypothetical protein
MAIDLSKEVEAKFGTLRAPTQDTQTFLSQLLGTAPVKSLRASALGRVLGGTSAKRLSFAGAQYDPGGSVGENLYRNLNQREIEGAKKKYDKESAISGEVGSPRNYKLRSLVAGRGYNVRDQAR